MLDFMQHVVDLDARSAWTIAAVLREIAAADGEHPQEAALIEAFEAALPEGGGGLDLSSLDSPARKEALLRSMVMMGLADQSLSAPERALMLDYTAKVGLSEADFHRVHREVASRMLAYFAGVHVFRDEVVGLGRRLGLAEADIAAVLGD